MRSDLVFGAMKIVPNRYLLSQVASKAARRLHRPGTRMQDTANDVLERFSRSNPIRSERAARMSPKGTMRPQLAQPTLAHNSDVPAFVPARESSNPLWDSANSLSA